MLFKRLLCLLVPGIWIGLIDGYFTLLSERSFPGTWSERIGTIFFCILLDSTLFVLLAISCGILAMCLARFRLVQFRRAFVFLTCFLLFLIPGAILVEESDSLATLPCSFLTGIAVVFLSSLAAGVLAMLASSRFERYVSLGERKPALKYTALICLPLAVSFAAASVGWNNPSSRPSEECKNVLLISLDTLRADHLSCYGYERRTSPNLDALARGGSLFEHAYSQSHWTLPSHASMLTGLNPVSLGVLEENDIIDDSFTTLAERMQEKGYLTAAFAGVGAYSYMGGPRGFDQGFEMYCHAPYPPYWCRGTVARFLNKIYWKYFQHYTCTATRQIECVERWLDTNHESRFFLFLHLFDIHSDVHRLPYESPPPFHGKFDENKSYDYTGRAENGHYASQMLKDYAHGILTGPMDKADLNKMVSYYDGGIAFTDHELGRLFKTMKGLGLDKRTVVIVTSDHGEAFFEHGKPLHQDLYDENLHVPLIIASPDGIPGQRIRSSVRLIDICPTILDLAGISASKEIEGKSFADVVLKGQRDRPSEIVFSFATELSSLRTDKWKFIRHHRDSSEELYDLGSDPSEKINLVLDSDLEVASELREQLLKYENECLSFLKEKLGGRKRKAIVLPDDEVERLRSLGYGP